MTVFCYSGIPDFFCDPVTNSCLLLGLTSLSWSDARSHCQMLGMDLAAFETMEEVTFAISIMPTTSGKVTI